MKRREFITLLGGAAASPLLGPLAARAQQPTMQVIGHLRASSTELDDEIFGMFRRGLNDAGFVEGRNVAIESRVTEQNNRLPALAAELVGRKVAVIYANSFTAAAAAKTATSTIPIVFSGSGDPIRVGLVPSLNRPGGNLTGVTSLGVELVPKRLELLRELVPQATVIGVLTNPTTVTSAGNMEDLQAAARSVAQEIVIVRASSEQEIDAAFATIAQQRIGALLVDVSALFRSRRDQIVTLAARHAVPASYVSRNFVEGGGLMSYGVNVEHYSQAGIYVGRILKGEKPADLPVLQPTKFEFVINLKAAKALGITFPPSFHLRADEVIE